MMDSRLRVVLGGVAVAALVMVVALMVGSTAAEAQDYSGHTAVLTTAEYLTVDGEGDGIEYFVDGANFELLQRDTGNGQLSQDFVYNDPRAAWDAVPDVSYGVKYANTSADVNLENQGYWLSQSLHVWDSEQCSGLELTENDIADSSPGLVEFFFNSGVINLALTEADVTQVGFLSAAEFPFFAANPNVLGVAFTLSWVDADGNLTDIDNNGKSDVALREIYYNDQFEWSDNGVGGDRGSGIFDFPTVAIHEAGHGLSAAHFGSIGRQAGQLVANPRTVMNAIYGGVLRELTGRDSASHCSNWAQWPNN